jgi:hypothetical protein
MFSEHNPYTPCKQIFQEVCDALGAHYVQQGFRYARSRPRISYKTKDIKLEISFWSSAYNTPGDYILLETIPNFYRVGEKRPMFSHPALFYDPFPDSTNPNLIKIEGIFGDTSIESIVRDWGESIIINTWRCNVYGMDEDKFKMLTDFIDQKIIYWLPKLATREGIEELIQKASQTQNGRDAIEQLSTKNQ